MHRDWSFHSDVEARCGSLNIWVSSETNSAQSERILGWADARRKGWNQDAAASVRYKAANMTCASSFWYWRGSALKVRRHWARNSRNFVGSVPVKVASSFTLGPRSHSTTGGGGGSTCTRCGY